MKRKEYPPRRVVNIHPEHVSDEERAYVARKVFEVFRQHEERVRAEQAAEETRKAREANAKTAGV